MGTTSGYICLSIGISSLIASIWRPGSHILAAIALYAAYVNLKAGKTENNPLSPSINPSIHDPSDVPIVQCQNCGTENFAVAKVCRGCNKSLKPLD